MAKSKNVPKKALIQSLYSKGASEVFSSEEPHPYVDLKFIYAEDSENVNDSFIVFRMGMTSNKYGAQTKFPTEKKLMSPTPSEAIEKTIEAFSSFKATAEKWVQKEKEKAEAEAKAKAKAEAEAEAKAQAEHEAYIKTKAKAKTKAKDKAEDKASAVQ